ncbi:MAG: GAF domain-containing sensor histidine kinase [Nitrospirae bacterium]|nr:MAG: GAF domain-containing sensor histidine kinase [Nitrospirota bacterium]
MSMYHLARFSLKEMAECGAELRKLGAEAQSLEEAAGRIVRHLYGHLGDSETGKKDCVLVRLFKTHPFGGLDQELQRYARGLLGTRPAAPSIPCFTLMATAGLLPEWNDRHQSKRFKAIPIADHQFVSQFPMFSQLMTQFGVELGTILESHTELLLDRHETSYNVFHVSEALGSPYVPGQAQFVVPYGVRSVLGFGGLLPSGSLFTVILFSRVPIPRDTAELFRTLTLSVKIALLPFDGRADFTEREEPREAALAKGERAINVVNWLQARMAVQEQLIQAHDQAVIDQANRIEAAMEKIRDQAEALGAIEKGTARAAGDDFFHSLVSHLAIALKVRYALVGEVVRDKTHIRTIAVWAGKDFRPNFEYALADSPCERVVAEDPQYFGQGVQRHFPNYPFLAELQAEGYCGMPLVDRQGKVLGLLVVLHDRPLDDEQKIRQVLAIFATRAGAELERQRAEAILREQNVALAQAMPGISEIDAQGRYVKVNPIYAGLLGYTPEEMVGMPRTQTVHPDDHRIVRETYDRMLREGKAESEVRAVRKDGTVFYKHIMMVKSVAGSPSESGHHCFMRDITERKHLEEQLQRAAKMEAIGRLAGGVAHDFNNLLTAITGYGEMLFQKLAPGSPLRDHAEEILKASERAAALTAQLLAFSRGQVVQPRALDVNRVVGNTAGLLRRLIGEHIELETRLAPKLFPIKADMGQLEQVLMNLAINARDAMPQGGSLVLETVNVPAESVAKPGQAPGSSLVRLSVSDTGQGMDENTLAHIFEPFFTTKAPGKGTGLGLAMVYGIVTKSGGTIAAESKPGLGSTFTIEFPAAGDAIETGSAPAAPAQALGGTETVLVVEDEEAVRNFVGAVLRSHGYRVLEAADGEAALALCGRDPAPIDLLLTDVVMPGMNGRGLAERFAVLRPGAGLLYMSGYTEDQDLQQGVQNLGDAFLSKPFSAAALAEAIRTALDARMQNPASAR